MKFSKAMMALKIVCLGLITQTAFAEDEGYPRTHFTDIALERCESFADDACLTKVYANGLLELNQTLFAIVSTYSESEQMYTLLKNQHQQWLKFIQEDCKVVNQTSGIGVPSCLIEHLDDRYRMLAQMNSV